jgi:hypothetical protein
MGTDKNIRVIRDIRDIRGHKIFFSTQCHALTNDARIPAER